MSGYIAEFFGYRAEDKSDQAIEAASRGRCPFLGARCSKKLSRDGSVSGVCAVRLKKPGSPAVICCPKRLYADNYKILRLIARKVFGSGLRFYPSGEAVDKAREENGAVAVFGQSWGGELRLPKRSGLGSYFVDWVLARLDGKGELAEITAVEVQTIDTTNNYRNARSALLDGRRIEADKVGLNWENVSKRIIPQLIYKGQVLQREELCKVGLFFVCPKTVYERILDRLGGRDRLITFPPQTASIHFVAYDYSEDPKPGQITPLGLIEERNTSVHTVQEAFFTIDLPEGNVYKNAIIRSLYHGGP